MTTLTTGYNVVKTPNVVQAQQRLYFVNDFDAMKVTDDGLVVRSVGIVAPSASPAAPTQAAGNCTVGTHLLRYRWFDSVRQRLSNPSDAISVTVSSTAKQLTVTNVVSADSTVDKIIWEMTAAGALSYYRISTVANAAGTAVLNTADENLINLIPSSFYGDFGHNPAPLAYIGCEHKQRVFLWGATERTFTGCTITNGSPTISGTGFSTQWAGRRVLITGYSTAYFVSSATATAITLTANFVGVTSAAAVITVTAPSPDVLTWSQSGFPESFDATSLARRITLKSGDKPAAMASVEGDLYLIGQRSMVRLNYTSDPAKGMVLPIPNSLGAFHQRCVTSDAAGLCAGWGRDGVWIIDSMRPVKISEQVDDTIASLADATQADARFIAYEPVQRDILCFFPLAGETSCKAAAVYNIPRQKWQIWKFRQGITTACINSAYTDRVRLMIADVNGYSWRMGVSINDGGAAGTYTAIAGSTTTVVNVTTTATVGQTAYRPSTGEERLISAVGASTVTVSVAFATAPTAGEEMWIGSIKQRIQTDWFVGDGLESKKRPGHLKLSVRPNTAMGEAKVYLYRDFLSTPISFSSVATDQFPTGITPASDHMLVDLDAAVVDGFVAIPLTKDWSRAIRAEIIAQEPQSGLRILDLSFDLRKTDSSKDIAE